MKPIAFSLLIAAACAGWSPAVAADSKTDSQTPSTTFYVTVQGRMTSAPGSPLEATLTADLEKALVSLERSTGDAPPRLVAVYPEHASTGVRPLFPNARKQANAPVATTGAE